MPQFLDWWHHIEDYSIVIFYYQFAAPNIIHC